MASTTSSKDWREKLAPGTLVYCTDLISIVSFTAEVVEPGVVDDDLSVGEKLVWIKWAGNGNKDRKLIPLGNVESIIPPTRCTRRKNHQVVPHKLDFNSIKVVPTRNLNVKKRKEKVPAATCRKKQFVKKYTNDERKKLFNQYQGPPIQKISEESNRQQNYIKFLFGESLIIEENNLDGAGDPSLEKTLTNGGKNYHLVLSRKKDRKGKSFFYGIEGNKVYQAYYVGGDLYPTADSVKRKLEEIADFSQLGMHPGKLASRLELMLSTAHNECPGVLTNLKELDFDLIDENANQYDGCGFVPSSFLHKYCKIGTVCVQVRAFSPALGIFKGLLFAKSGIEKIQLPPSMLKVPGYNNDSETDQVHILINNCFPSSGCNIMDKWLKQGKLPTKKKLFEWDGLSPCVKTLLKMHGLTDDDIDDYCNEFWDPTIKSLYQPRNDSSMIVGVSDPTSELPKDHVFVTGMNSNDCSDKVFITRNPCTQKSDGGLVNLVAGKKPVGMSKSNWDYLQSLPFGFVIFGHSSDPTRSLAAATADGDLDGDHYHVFWHSCFIDHLKDMKVKDDEEECRSNIDVTTDADEWEGGYARVVDHKGNKVTIEYTDEDGDQKVIEDKLHALKNDKEKAYHTILAEYANEQNIMDKCGWKWTKSVFTDTSMSLIDSHTVDDSGIITFNVKYDDASTEKSSKEEMIQDAPDILYNYASENKLLSDWCKKYSKKSRDEWFQKLQNYCSDKKLLNDADDLIKNLFSLCGKAFEEDDIAAVEAFSCAYKKALEFRKHSHDITLPLHLVGKVRKRLQSYVLND